MRQNEIAGQLPVPNPLRTACEEFGLGGPFPWATDRHLSFYLYPGNRGVTTLWARKRRADERVKYAPRSGILFSLSHGGWRYQFRHIRTLALGTFWGRITGRYQEHFKDVRTVFTFIFVNRHYFLRKKFAGLNEITRRPFLNIHLEQYYRNIFETTAICESSAYSTDAYI